MGGDEFAILLPEASDHYYSRSIAEKILEAIRKDFVIDGITMELRASAGIALYPDQASDFTTLMRYADVAMYKAKQTTMASIEVYNPDTDEGLVG